MRKIYIVLFAIAIAGLLLSSCKKDRLSEAASIEGKWFYTEYKISGFKNGVETIATFYTKAHFEDRFWVSFDGYNAGEQSTQDPLTANFGSFTYILANSVLTVKPTLLFPKHEKFVVKKLSDTEMTFTVRYDNADGSYELQVLRLHK